MDTDQTADFWNRIQQSGVGVTELLWIRDNLPEHLEDAWEIFRKSARQDQLGAVMWSFPALRERAWKQYEVHATGEDLAHVADCSEETWIAFKERAPVEEIIRWMHRFRDERLRDCFEAVRSRAFFEFQTYRAFIELLARGRGDIAYAAWTDYRAYVADRKALSEVLRRCYDKRVRSEAWDDLKRKATASDLRNFVDSRYDFVEEAASLLLQRSSSIEDLWCVVTKVPTWKKVTGRLWWKKETVELAAVARKAADTLLKTELTTGELQRLLGNITCDDNLVQRINVKIAQLETADESPTIRMLKRLNTSE